LAADINKISAESATVSRATVTLTNEVRLETALTVPAGVTLDLTKETLQLSDSAVLIVNGTVNAKAEGVNVDSAAASPATINGSGTIRLASKGCLLGIWEGKKLILDGVTLVGLKDNSNSLVEVDIGGEFVLQSGTITGNSCISGDWAGGGGVGVSEGTFTMEGGAISDNSASGGNGSTGGGVAIWGGIFIMKGGSISGNSATGGTGEDAEGAGGGGVFVSGNSEGTTFTMEGGTISGNSVTGKWYGVGGGVWVERSATFTMEGGMISDNSVSATNTEDDAHAAFGDPLPAGVWGGAGSGVYVDDNGTAKWGTGGTYTKGGVSQTGGADIGSTDDTLIAAPAK
jgi:hypothetical protein